MAASVETVSGMMRGFLTLQLAAILAAGAVILALGIALKVQSARLDAKEAELSACVTRYEETLILVKKQNEAVQQLEDEAKKRAKRASDALAKAREGQQSLEAELKRLRDSGASGKVLTCEDAVREVRKGLKP